MQRRKCQSTLEYAMIIAVVVAVLLMMQHYVKRGVAGKLRSSADDIGEQFDPDKHTGVLTSASDSYVHSTNNLAADPIVGVQKQTYLDLGGADATFGRTQSKTGNEGSTGYLDTELLLYD